MCTSTNTDADNSQAEGIGMKDLPALGLAPLVSGQSVLYSPGFRSVSVLVFSSLPQ